MPEWKDRMPGGLADKKSPQDFDPEAVLKGMKVELEHTDDDSRAGRLLAIEIALDHLAENPKYYDELATIEDHDEGEAEVHTPQVRKAKPHETVFVEGDDLVAEVGAVADALIGRGSGRLGAEALNWLQDVTAARRS